MKPSKESRVWVVGLGKTGASCVRFLKRQGLDIGVMDTREKPPELAWLQTQYPGTPLILGGLDEKILSTAKMIILSPGLSQELPAIQKAKSCGVPVVGDIELFAREVKAPVIAITGSNAKSTVTTLVGEMAKALGLRVQVGGNLGTPALDLLAEPVDVYVLELSSFQLETTVSLKPKVAALLNISEDHLDRYPSFADYIAAKHRIYLGAAVAICNEDDKATWPLEDRPTIRFGSFGIVRAEGEQWLSVDGQLLLKVNALTMKGQHAQLNVLAAFAIAKAMGWPLTSLVAVVQAFQGLPHRCQWVIQVKGVDWYNDSKGTNLGATIAALRGVADGLSGKVILLAGGIAKQDDFSLLGQWSEQLARAVVLYGQDAPRLAKGFVDRNVSLLEVNTLAEAVHEAAKIAQTGDVVLLSPACASFDQFKNYEHRGEVFKELVLELHKEER